MNKEAKPPVNNDDHQAAVAAGENLPGDIPDSSTCPAPDKLPWKRLATIFALFSLLGILWGTLVPLGGYNDEWMHVRYGAAVVRGQIPVTDCDAKPPVSNGVVNNGRCKVSIPKSLVEIDGFICLAFHPDNPDSCVENPDSGDNSLVEVNNSAANYPPLYYLLVGWPSLFLSGASAWYAMRIINALICAFLLATIFAGLNTFLPFTSTLLVLGALTPVTITYFGAVNPQGPEILSSGALAAVVFSIALSRRPTYSCLLAAALILVFLANIRTPGIVWAFITVVMWIILMDLNTIKRVFMVRRWGIPLAIALGGVGVSLAWTLMTSSLVTVLGQPRPDLTFVQMAKEMVAAAFASYIPQMIGFWGWDDNSLPAALTTCAALFLLAIFLGALWLGNWRQRIGLLVGIVSLPICALAISYPQVKEAGIIWAGRYSLPTFFAVAMLVVGVWGSRFPRSWMLPALNSAVFIILATSSAYCAVRRYAVGKGKDLPWDFPVHHQILLALFLVILIAISVVLGYWIWQQRKLNRAIKDRENTNLNAPS